MDSVRFVLDQRGVACSRRFASAEYGGGPGVGFYLMNYPLGRLWGGVLLALAD